MLCPFAMKHGTDSLITDVGQAVATYAVTEDVHATAGNVAISISTMREDTGLCSLILRRATRRSAIAGQRRCVGKEYVGSGHW